MTRAVTHALFVAANLNLRPPVPFTFGVTCSDGEIPSVALARPRGEEPVSARHVAENNGTNCALLTLNRGRTLLSCQRIRRRTAVNAFAETLRVNMVMFASTSVPVVA